MVALGAICFGLFLHVDIRFKITNGDGSFQSISLLGVVEACGARLVVTTTCTIYIVYRHVDLPGLSELGANSGLKKPKIDPDHEEDFGKAKLIAPLPKRNNLHLLLCSL